MILPHLLHEADYIFWWNCCMPGRQCMELRSNRATQVPLPDFCFKCWDKPKHANGPLWVFASETLLNWTLKTWWSMTTLIRHQTFTSSFTRFCFCHAIVSSGPIGQVFFPNSSRDLPQMVSRQAANTRFFAPNVCTGTDENLWFETLVWDIYHLVNHIENWAIALHSSMTCVRWNAFSHKTP